MFDATKGKQAITDQIDTGTDGFAGWFDDLKPAEQLDVINRLNDHGVRQGLLDGKLESQQQPQPAALGSGPSSAIDTNEAIKVILADTTVDAGFKHLLRRGYDQSAPDHIEVETDGTPKALRSSQQETKSQKDRADDAERKLGEQQDDTKSGSLAHQLKVAKAASATPADMVEKTKVVAGLTKLRDMVDAIKPIPMKKGGASSKADALKAIDGEIAKVS